MCNVEQLCPNLCNMSGALLLQTQKTRKKNLVINIWKVTNAPLKETLVRSLIDASNYMAIHNPMQSITWAAKFPLNVLAGGLAGHFIVITKHPVDAPAHEKRPCFVILNSYWVTECIQLLVDASGQSHGAGRLSCVKRPARDCFREPIYLAYSLE